jgi:hypothetical protein
MTRVEVANSRAEDEDDIVVLPEETKHDHLRHQSTQGTDVDPSDIVIVTDDCCGRGTNNGSAVTVADELVMDGPRLNVEGVEEVIV